MKSKLISFALVAVLLVVALWLSNRNNSSTEKPRTSQRPSTNRNSGEKSRGFIRKVSYLEYTAHAKCRMKCRHITQEEVEDIMKNGNVNYNKSDLADNPCPTYALDGYTMKDNQHVRIVFAQCLQKTKVVTCIDLDEEDDCACK